MYAAGGDTELALSAFTKSLNVEMCLAIVAQTPSLNTEEVRSNLIERLKNASRFEQAADLICNQLSSAGDNRKHLIEQVVDCYLKANKYLKAY